METLICLICIGVLCFIPVSLLVIACMLAGIRDKEQERL